MRLLASRNALISAGLFLTILAAALRFYRLDNQSLWTDEVSSIVTARAPLSQIPELSEGFNNSPPYYFLVLRFIIGKSDHDIEFKARLLSVIAGSLSIPVLVSVVRLWRQRWDTALLAGLLLAINPLHLWYSQEARGYALMLFFGLLSLLAFERAVTHGAFGGSRGFAPMWWCLYSVFALSSLAIHKTGLTFPLVCAVWQGWQFLKSAGVSSGQEIHSKDQDERHAFHKSAFRRRGLALFVHIALLTVGFILLNRKTSPPPKVFTRAGSILEIPYTGMTFLGGYSFGPSLTDIQSYGPMGAISRHLLQVAILGIVLMLLAVVFAGRFRSFIAARETMLLLVGIGIVAIGASLSGFPYNVRYALPALFGFLALIATMATFPQVNNSLGFYCLRYLLVFSVVSISLHADVNWYFSPAYRKADSRAVARWLVENHPKSWTVLPDYLSDSVQWYLGPRTDVLSSFIPAKGHQTTSFPPVPDVLILGRRHHLVEPDKLIADYYAAAGRVRATRSFAGFELYFRDQ